MTKSRVDIHVEGSENISILVNDIDDFKAKLEATLDRLEAQYAKSLSDAERGLEDAKHDKVDLRDHISTLKSQLANLEKAYEEEKEKSAKVEKQLKSFGNRVSNEDLDMAIELVRKLDYRAAEDIFQDIKSRTELDKQASARADYGLGKIAEAELRWFDAADHYESAAGAHKTFQHYLKAGELLWRIGQYDRAVFYEKENIALAKSEFGETHENYGKALNNYAESLRSLGRNADAEPLLEKALANTKSSLGKDHANYGTHLNNLAGLYLATGRYAEAEQLYVEALANAKAALGMDHADYGIRLNNLAGLYWDTGRNADAEPLLKKALANTKAALGADHASYGIRLNNLARLYQDAGRYAEAERLYVEALANTKAALGTDHASYGIRLNNLAMLYDEAGRYAEAEPLYVEAVVVFDRALGPDHPDTKKVKANYEIFLAEKAARENDDA